MRASTADKRSSVVILNNEKRNWRSLLPIELHQIIVGPSEINFSNVTVKSAATKDIKIVNNLKEDIIFEIEISCEELEHTSPVELVVPKETSVDHPLVFESETLGRFS